MGNTGEKITPIITIRRDGMIENVLAKTNEAQFMSNTQWIVLFYLIINLNAWYKSAQSDESRSDKGQWENNLAISKSFSDHTGFDSISIFKISLWYKDVEAYISRCKCKKDDVYQIGIQWSSKLIPYSIFIKTYIK